MPSKPNSQIYSIIGCIILHLICIDIHAQPIESKDLVKYSKEISSLQLAVDGKTCMNAHADQVHTIRFPIKNFNISYASRLGYKAAYETISNNQLLYVTEDIDFSKAITVKAISNTVGAGLQAVRITFPQGYIHTKIIENGVEIKTIEEYHLDFFYQNGNTINKNKLVSALNALIKLVSSEPTTYNSKKNEIIDKDHSGDNIRSSTNQGMNNGQTATAVKKVLELKMPKTSEDSMPGKRGASITWHPEQKKYYAVMAGNSDFPLGIFDSTGKRLSSENLTAKIDTRGLWYNPKKQTVCGNGYANNGWFKYLLGPKGAVLDIEIDPKDKLQPSDQSVGTYYPEKDVVLFLEGNRVVKYDALGVKENVVDLRLGLTEKDDIGEKFEWKENMPKKYNNTTLIFTGIKNAELGVLNTEKKQIELYSYDKGFLAREIKLPEDASVESTFNFAYANGMFWLFNMETRLWSGYK